jgi:hypothetical protein
MTWSVDEFPDRKTLTHSFTNVSLEQDIARSVLLLHQLQDVIPLLLPLVVKVKVDHVNRSCRGKLNILHTVPSTRTSSDKYTLAVVHRRANGEANDGGDELVDGSSRLRELTQEGVIRLVRRRPDGAVDMVHELDKQVLHTQHKK